MSFKLRRYSDCYNLLNIMASVFKISVVCVVFYFCEASQISGVYFLDNAVLITRVFCL